MLPCKRCKTMYTFKKSKLCIQEHSLEI